LKQIALQMFVKAASANADARAWNVCLRAPAAMIEHELARRAFDDVAAVILRDDGERTSEVDTGSRQENASNQESRAPFRFNRNGKGSSSLLKNPKNWAFVLSRVALLG
jgi:hypothetical protein